MLNIYNIVKKRFTYILLIFSLFLNGCSSITAKNNAVTKAGLYFDTVITLTVYGERAQELIETCFDKCEEYENLFSRTVSNSDISRINNANGEEVIVSEETLEIIEKGIYYGELSEGLFDITIGPVVELWDFHGNNQIPDEEDIKQALSHVSYKNIIVNKENSIVRLTDPMAKIDLGALAKGYIADKLKEYLVSEGVTSALINLGGNIEAVGCKPDNSPFRIGIKKPFSDNEIETFVDLLDKAVSSSGVYERYFYIDDKLFHHILDPNTGYPVETDLFGVSVVCDSSTDADAFGTICILMGYERAKELMDSQKNMDVIWSFAK